jgi:hypothetical protein
MDPAWRFEHTIEVRANRKAAWSFWSNMDNWALVDPDVEWARLDGPFVAGTRGETKPKNSPATHWVLSEVVPEKRVVIEMALPGAVLHFVWTFSDGISGGAILTQAVELTGENAGEYVTAMKEFELGIPAGMAKLASTIDRFQQTREDEEP